jgi:hypothetical protein
MLDPFRFSAVCPKCKDVRSQSGFTRRALRRLLVRDEAIEAYCVVCDKFWPLSEDERAALAKQLAD